MKSHRVEVCSHRAIISFSEETMRIHEALGVESIKILRNWVLRMQ